MIVVGILFAMWAGGNTVQRQVAGAQAAQAFEESMRNKMLQEVVEYRDWVNETGGAYEFAAVNHAPGSGPPQGTNAGAVGAETSFYAILPPTGPAAFSIGQSDILLSYIPINMRNIFDVSRQVELENPANLQTGSFDIAFVVIFLLPIFILAMSYDLLSSEKERGTLAMILAHPVSIRELMASKLISRARLLMTVVVLFGLAALLIMGDNLGQIDTWIRFALWMTATLLYGCFWFALAVLVNAMGQKSATNGMILASTWLILVVIVPTLISIVATTSYSPPSRMDLTIAARNAQTEAETSRMAALDQYYYDHMELVPEDKARDFLTLSIANSEAIEKSVRPIYDEFQAQLNRQEALVQRFQYLSPAIMMQLALNEISGTSADRYEHFMNQVYAFHAEWREHFSSLFLSQTPLRPEHYAEFPSFQFQEESLGTLVLRTLPSLLGLFVLMSLLTFLGFRALRNYEIGGH